MCSLKITLEINDKCTVWYQNDHHDPDVKTIKIYWFNIILYLSITNIY